MLICMKNLLTRKLKIFIRLLKNSCKPMCPCSFLPSKWNDLHKGNYTRVQYNWFHFIDQKFGSLHTMQYYWDNIRSTSDLRHGRIGGFVSRCGFRKPEKKKKRRQKWWSKKWYLERANYGHKLLVELTQNELDDHKKFLRMDAESFEELSNSVFFVSLKEKHCHACGYVFHPQRLSLTLRHLATGNTL